MKHLQKIFLFPALCLFFLFAGCSKQEDIYALPPIPQGEVRATDKKVAKPDEIKIYCDKKVVNLSQTVTEELWSMLDSIFNAGYEENGYYDLVYEGTLKELKKTETCLELLYRQKQVREGEGKEKEYFGTLTILTPRELRYIRYFESYDEEGNLCFHTNFFEQSVSGEEFAETYAAFLEKIESLKG